MDDYLYSTPIPRETQALIADRLWATPSSQSLGTQAYFNFYSYQCRDFHHAFNGNVPLKTHGHLMQIVDDLMQPLKRSEVKSRLSERCIQEETLVDGLLEGMIDLAVKLVAMIDVGQLPYTHSGRFVQQWTDPDSTLGEFLATVFKRQREMSCDGTKLGAHFTARNLDVIGGLEVELTPNLADHLKLQYDKVLIFHHASFLRSQSRDMFPPGLVEETIQTLALLFPRGDKATKRWYRAQENVEDQDQSVLNCTHINRNIDSYYFWRDRLVILKDRFDEPVRTTWRQLWNDRREGTQWYALWVAVGFTVFFGLVQSIEGALQVYKAFQES